MKRLTLIVLGLFIFYMGYDIHTKIETFKKSGEAVSQNLGAFITEATSFESPPTQAKIEQMSNDVFSSIGNMNLEYFRIIMNLPASITLMIIGTISIITGVFDNRFWKALLDYLMPTP